MREKRTNNERGAEKEYKRDGDKADGKKAVQGGKRREGNSTEPDTGETKTNEAGGGRLCRKTKERGGGRIDRKEGKKGKKALLVLLFKQILVAAPPPSPSVTPGPGRPLNRVAHR